jgi:hypothetical protein
MSNLKREKIWKIQKKGKLNNEKDMENKDESRLNSEMISKIWKKK